MDYLKFTIWIFVFLTVDKSLAIFTEYVELCSNRQEIRLTGHDSRASAIVLLDPTLGMPSERCTLQVSAPPGFVINMGIIEDKLEIHRALVIDHSERYIQCPLNVYLPAEDNHTDPIYHANLCSLDSTPQPPLFPPDRLLLTWTPSSSLTSEHIRGRQILLTAVGQSPAICNASSVIGPVASVLGDYHACMTVGRQPLLCVSRHLVCNEQDNCPRGSTYSDEDEAMCRRITPDQNSWEELARKLMQQWNLPLDGFSEKWVQNGGGKLRVGDEEGFAATTETTVGKIVSIWKKIEATTKRPNTDQSSNSTSETTSNNSDPLSISAVLNQYGPWGYLMLGMLLCGTVLLLCGIWECCFRTPKPRARSHHHGGLAGGISSPNTTVLIISAEETAQHPPNYEDLDQPPLYTVLFPTAPESGTVGDDANKPGVVIDGEDSSEIVMRRLSGGSRSDESSVRTLGEDEERLREVSSVSDVVTSASDNATS